jgi:hypothetical protein
MTDNKQVTLKKFSSYEKFVIAILALTQFTVVLDFMVMSPLGDMLMKSMNLTNPSLGLPCPVMHSAQEYRGCLLQGLQINLIEKNC